MTHGELLNECLLILSERGHLAWSNPTGAMKVDDRFLRYGFKGSHDILGVLQGGRAIGVEVKVGRDTVKPHQRLFHDAFAARGGLSIVARSVDDVLAAIA